MTPQGPAVFQSLYFDGYTAPSQRLRGVLGGDRLLGSAGSRQQRCIKAPSRGLSPRRLWEAGTGSGVTLGVLMLPPELLQLK